MRERREFRRYNTPLFGTCVKASGCMRISSLVAIKNIGLGGLCAILSKITRKGDRLLIELYFPDNKRLATLAEVVWIKQSESTEGNVCGLKFLSISSVPLLVEYISYVRELSIAS